MLQVVDETTWRVRPKCIRNERVYDAAAITLRHHDRTASLCHDTIPRHHIPRHLSLVMTILNTLRLLTWLLPTMGLTHYYESTRCEVATQNITTQIATKWFIVFKDCIENQFAGWRDAFARYRIFLRCDVASQFCVFTLCTSQSAISLHCGLHLQIYLFAWCDWLDLDNRLFI